MTRGLLILCWIVLVIGAATGTDRAPVVLERARSMKSFEESGIRRTELSGDVWITKDSLTVTCQKAIYYPDSGILLFDRSVEFRQPGRILFADKVTYDELTEEVEATGHVRVFQDSLRISARRALYRERFKNGYFYDDVRIKDTSRNIRLRGDLGYFDHEREYARVTGNPVLTELDSSFALETEIRGDTLEYFGQEKLVRATGDVVATRDSLISFGTLLTYHNDSSYAEMIGEPHAQQGLHHVSGDTLRLYFQERELERVEILGHAFATSPADSLHAEPLNRMEGKQMTLWIEEGVIGRVVVIDNAIATYYIREAAEPRGLNITSGDRLDVFFEDARISHIRVEGGTQGEYTPQRLVRAEEE